MNETQGKFSLASGLSFENQKEVAIQIYDVANVAQVTGLEDKVRYKRLFSECLPKRKDFFQLCFAGQTLCGKCSVLISLGKTAGVGKDVRLIVNCEKMVIGSMLFKLLKASLT